MELKLFLPGSPGGSEKKKWKNGRLFFVAFFMQVNLDLTISVLTFLLSDNALFLREPLINELLDTMDEVGCCSRGLDARYRKVSVVLPLPCLCLLSLVFPSPAVVAVFFYCLG